MEYKISEDAGGIRHFPDYKPEDLNYTKVIHESKNPYIIGYLPKEALKEVRVGDRFHSLGMVYAIQKVGEFIYVVWID